MVLKTKNVWKGKNMQTYTYISEGKIHGDAIKMIWTVDDSEHTEMWLDYNQEYRDKVEDLLNSLK